ncbi:glutamine synthetase family protein [Zavarzinia compransoris]|uniref:glutamine synthetase family protein n=1 Tax=Zavarzinia marina TaxID=2911065 RepID=UPI001F3C7F4D|nr:glutamine synthetase family protein [Zavarzinia marina]MCF4165799.1 glutamine synthetase family protein [Zavarzinia marina]
MKRHPFVMAVCSDFAGQVRGKGFPAEDLPARLAGGVGWTPTNVMINCFGAIPATPFGPRGDLLLMPDLAAEVCVDFEDGSVPEHFLLGDIVDMARRPWSCCTRHYLKSAIARLSGHGLRLRVAFEHEFFHGGVEERPGGSYGLDAIRRAGDFPHALIAAIAQAGLEPETVLPEYGPRQIEVTLRPALALAAADRAVMLRQIVHALAWRRGHRVSFSPVVTHGVVGNGVHIHFSLEDMDGKPLSHDPARPCGVSAIAGRFIAGVIEHGRALTALTAPSVLSYERLKPNSWSTTVTNLGYRDREAFVRICPVSDVAGADVGRAFNFEYRACDGAATPHLALGALIRAGLAGIEAGLETPAITMADPDGLSPGERAASNIRPLPASLGEALDALEKTGNILMESDEMRAAYLMHKRGEIATVEGLDLPALAARYALVY